MTFAVNRFGNRHAEAVPFFIGILFSLISHLLGVILFLALVEQREAAATRAPEVFSVTLEGGEVLGGTSQAPKPNLKEDKKVLPHVPREEESKAEESTEKKEAEKKLETPSVVEDPQKILEERKRKEEAEKKKVELEKKKIEEEKKKKEEAKKKADEAKKKKEELAKKEQERKLRNKKLQDAIKNAARRYEGESADAGGTGFGAARLGGKGMGGGTLQSAEFIAYQSELKRHIKSGWHILPGKDKLRAQVLLSMLPDGTVRNAEVVGSSGSAPFDESALRAVYKASPLPVPPQGLYEQFREVRITFDSEERD